MLYAVIIGLWICILLPMWLRRHDEALESRSVDRFSSAMRTLSRRSTGDSREVMMPARGREPLHADGPERAAAQGRAVLAARRRRSLSLLVAGTLVVAGFAALGMVSVWAVLAPVVLLIGFLIHLRRESQAQLLRDRRRRAQFAAAETRRQRPPSRQRVHDVEVERILPRAEPLLPEWETALASAGLDLEVLSPTEMVVAEVSAESPADVPYDSEAERAWAPIPVPLPTYVTAPKAPRSVRVIDLTKPGLWTSGHVDAEEAARLEEEAVAHEAAIHLSEGSSATAVRHEPTDGGSIVTGELVIERRRAVND